MNERRSFTLDPGRNSKMKRISALRERRRSRNTGLFTGMFVTALILLGVFGMSAQAKTLTKAEKAKIKYAQYLNTHETKGKNGYVETFAIASLDDNDVPDLFERTDGVVTLSYLNGNVYKGSSHTWSDMFVAAYVYPKTGVYAYWVYDSDGSTRAEFLYRRLVVRTNGIKDVYVAGMVKTGDGLRYYIGEKENIAAMTEKSGYEARIRKYAGTVSAKKIVFIENTKENRKKYLGDSGEIASITMSKKKLTLSLNETATIKASVKNAVSNKITWKSGNSKVVTVEADPLEEGRAILKAKSGGIVKITATIDGVTATCTVTVDAPSIELDKTSAKLLAKKTLKLKAIVTGDSKTVTWKSSNKKVASVSKGVVTGNKAGKAVITATANGKSASCSITVISPKENVSGLTAVKADKDYIVRMESGKEPVYFLRKGSRLYADDKEVMTLKTGYPAYAVYFADIKTGDGKKEILVLSRNSSGKSAMEVYRYSNGALKKYASVSGVKNSTAANGFSYNKGQSVSVPGNGTVTMSQKLILNGKDTITASMRYTVASGKIVPLQYKNNSTVLSASSPKITLKKAKALLKTPGGAKNGKTLDKNAKYTVSDIAFKGSNVYLKVTSKNTTGWMDIAVKDLRYK